MRIAFIAGVLGQGGAERQLYYVLKTLRENITQVDEVRLYTLTRGEFWEERIRALGVRTEYFGGAQSRFLRLFKLLRMLREFRPNVIQSQHFYTNCYVAAASWAIGSYGIGAMRNDGRSEFVADGRLAGTVNLRWPRVLAANSRVALDFASERGVPKKRLFFLPNVIDTHRFEYKKGLSAQDRPYWRVLTIGRQDPQKRLDRFLRIIKGARDELGCGMRGAIVTGGQPGIGLEPGIAREAEQLGLLGDGLEVCSAVDEVEREYWDADAFLLTSDYEGTPNVVMEAMATGVPVVATRVGGVPDLIRDGSNGLLFSADDEQEGLAKLLELLKKPEMRLRLAEEARRFIVKHHSISSLRERLERFYQNVVAAEEHGHGRVRLKGELNGEEIRA